MNKNKPLSGRIAVVTGATRQIGIGAAICRALAEAGADIFFTYWTAYDRRTHGEIDDEPLRLQEEIAQMGVRCAAWEGDLSAPGAAAQLLAEVNRSLGQPAILVNNAAYSTITTRDSLTEEELDAHYFINVRACMMLSVLFAREYRGQRGGRIINITSGQNLGPMPGELAYVATKGAIAALTPTLAAEVADKGITVNCINPGPTDTGWMTAELKERLLPKFPFGRIGLPTDAARLVRFLASDEAEWITGQVIHSEGGFLRI
ncbi:SDR family oxidoreductase [Brevibacillus sp. SYP-B805]|uniref:SDR family oxidoreductase n=1 Tax=Brevibacillus sp. SYP-B805 TaxID=1578199 RepID=UPI0013EC0F82|nr:SDR family oxidoreductase [Brevibacillus sp. SYP-B805]NGQ94798.1 SDR family oxidoreductase [Brevibacillus sp. SYP-B805]